MKKDYSKLKAIFEGKDDDMSRLERRKTSRLRQVMRGLFIFLAFFLAVLAVSYFLFNRAAHFTGDNVQLSIQAATTVSSGKDITYTINYANLENVPLRQADIELKYPEGFVFSDATPKPTDSNNHWTLGSLPSNKSGQIQVTGKLIGEKDSVKTVTGVLTYIPANFSSEFQKVETADTSIKESPITFKVEGPDNALAGDKATYLVTIQNTSDNNFTDLKLIASYPDSFVFGSSQPDPVQDTNTWSFDQLVGQEQKTVQIDGQIDSGATDKLNFTWQIGVQVGDKLVILDEIKSVTEVVKGDLSVDLILNGANESKGVAFGDTLNYSIDYKNNSDTRLSEFTVVLTINSIHTTAAASAKYSNGIVDFDSLKDLNNGVLKKEPTQPEPSVLESRTITWTKKEVKNLTFLDPAEEGKLDFTVNLKSLADLKAQSDLGDLSDLAVQSSVQVMVGKTGNLTSSTEVKTNTITSAVNTNLKLSAEGRYYDAGNGDQLGNGPLPPQVGQDTTYRIFWTLNNDLHEVKDVTVFAVLPPEVTWNNKFDIGAGDIAYNPTSRTVTWTVNRIPVSVGTLKASFEVAFTPTKDDEGKVVTILPRSILTATDSQTDGKMTQSTNEVTTDLQNDTKASGKGVVQAAGAQLFR